MKKPSTYDPSEVGKPVAMLAQLSGSRRGKSDRISGETLLVGTAAESDVRLPADHLPSPGSIHAVLRSRGVTYEIEAAAGQSVWVNGEPVGRMLLASGDLLEMGRGGPILRFRLYPPDSPAYKRVSEAFADCRDCARYSDRGALGRAAMVVLGMRRELAVETSLKFRASVMVLLVALVASDAADVAVLKVEGLPSHHPALAFSTAIPQPGDEVVVLGYPLGVRALVVRTDQAFLEGLARQGDTGFWSIAERLSAAGHIAPLASRGIVGQVTNRAVVYDAETTSGGSGGPVLNMDGEIVAVNSAILPEFGGSNMGVPAAASLALLEAEAGN